MRISSVRDQAGAGLPGCTGEALTRGSDSEASADALASNSRTSTSGGDEAVAPRPNATRRRETPVAVGPPPYPRRAVHLPDRRIDE